MSQRLRNKGIAAGVAIGLHLLLVLFLLWVAMPLRQVEEQGAVLVNIGDIDLAAGTFTPADAVAPPEQAAPIQESEATDGTSEELLTQPDEEAPIMTPKPAKRPKPKPVTKPTPKPVVKAKPTPKPTPKPLAKAVTRPAEDAAAKAKALEAARLEEARRAEARRQEAIGKSVSGAFGAAKNSNTSSGTATSGSGHEGSSEGNVESGGSSKGVGGVGSFSLDGRSLSGGGLPRPSYSAQTEGTIVVRITVDPQGRVINTAIAPGTNIADYAMRQSALKAAAAARFNSIEGSNNQTGTITYRYRLR